MPRQTLIHTKMPADDADGTVAETWTILTHQVATEYWSEILDGHRHPHVHHDDYGFDTVIKYYGDSVEESRAAALEALQGLVVERGGRVDEVGETEEA